MITTQGAPVQPALTTTASEVLLDKHYSNLPLAPRFRDREHAFRALCLRFLFTELSICKLPCNQNTSFIGARTQGTAGNVQSPSSYTSSGIPIVSSNRNAPPDSDSTRVYMGNQATWKFSKKYGLVLWDAHNLERNYFTALQGYFEVLFSLEAKDEIWSAFWDGTDEDDVGGEEVGMGRRRRDTF